MITNNINIIKRSLFFILLSFIMVNAQAQTGLNFQGVARTSNNVILSSQAITIKLSILQGSSTGTVEYTETRKVTTNAQGLFTAVIGDTGAIITLGNFTTINWKLSPKFLKIEMDAAAGNNFITMGTTQFQYVAYAQFAKSVDAENLVGVVPVVRGGTGATNLSTFKSSLAIDKINNTADADKPISAKVQAALDLKSSLIDTSKYTKQTYTDSSLLTKLNISDTVAMLSSRIARDTLNLSNRINLKANATYVASELDLKLNAADTSKYTKQTYTDSSLLTKLKISDTAAMLSSRIARDTLNLSNRITSKANTTDVASGLALKENTSNKSIAVDLGGTTPSDILFPTQKAVKDYVTANNASGGISDGSIITIKIADDAVTDAKINTVSGSKVIGNITGNAATASLAGNITATANTTLTSLSNLNTVGTITSGVWSGTEVAIEKGGTGATTASAARTNLGLVIGINVQAPLVAGTDYLAPVSLTTTGASGASTFTSNTLNIPTYTLAGLGGISLSGVSATAPLSYNSGTGAFSIPIATTSANGYLSSTDWTTFNAKQTALTAGSGISISAGTISATGLTTSNLSSTAGITNAQLAGSIAASKLVGTDITTVGTLANLTVTNPIAGSITGNAATATTATTAGTASTATKLATPKNINGVAFDGSLDIIVTADAGTLTGTALNSTITGSSLISVGTLTNLTVTNPIAGSIKGNAATATLATNVTTNANLTGIVTSVGNTTNIANLAIDDARIASVSATKITGTLPVLNGGTGSATQNFVDLTTIQHIAGQKTFSSDISVNGITVGQGGGGISSNTASGNASLYSNTTGSYNTASGHASLYLNTTGNFNTANGNQSLENNTTGYSNTANGNQSLLYNTIGFSNTANGNESIRTNTTGTKNTANGDASLYFNTTGSYNTASGNRSLFSNTTGDGNTAIGYNANVGSNALSNATAIGNGAIVNNSNTIQLGNGVVTNVKTYGTITAGAITYPKLDGTANQVLTTNGSGVATFGSIPTLNQNTTGSAATLTTARNINGVAFDGSQDINISASADAGSLTGTALNSTITGSSLTSVGTLANLTVTNAIAGSITGNAATATQATNVTTNANLTGIVTSNGNTTNIANLAIDDARIASVSATKITGTLPVLNGGTGLNTAGTYGQILTSTNAGTLTWTTLPSAGVPYSGASGAIDLGSYDLTVNGLTVGRGAGGISSNTANGNAALRSNTTGTGNTANGKDALLFNTTGTSNTVNGAQALMSNTTGSYNTANGFAALLSNTTGSNNTANGFAALQNNTTGYDNTANGISALQNNTTGNNNTANGRSALLSNTTGTFNTANGFRSLLKNSTGGSNTASGYSAGTTNTTGNENTLIGYSADVSSNNLSNATAIGNGAIVNNSNTIQLGNEVVTNVKTNGTITAGAVTYPKLDGTANQVLTTNGSGVATFGSIPTLNQNTTGSAATLTTARNINGVAFDGSQDINISASADAGTLTGTALNSTITGSSLTSFGTLANLTVTNAIAGSITGNAATATLATTASLAGNITATANTTLTSLSNLNTVGTITSGVWSGTTLAIAKGGTGLIAAGTNGQVLTSTGSGTLIWTTPSGGGDVHTIGETYGGGKVFYVYDNGKHGLIAATSDQSTEIRWYGGSNTNTGARADGVGAGLKNTAIIIANQGYTDFSGYAATVCNEYSVTVDGVTYGDWYLPSKHELYLLYLRRLVVGGFAISGYWSSSESDAINAWSQFFGDGNQSIYGFKSNAFYVRAIRAF